MALMDGVWTLRLVEMRMAGTAARPASFDVDTEAGEDLVGCRGKRCEWAI